MKQVTLQLTEPQFNQIKFLSNRYGIKPKKNSTLVLMALMEVLNKNKQELKNVFQEKI
jgi:hypothetical protein